MINATMRLYDFFTLGQNDEYGQPQAALNPTGKVKMSINISSQTKVDNPLYNTASFVGLTMEDKLDTSSIVAYEGMKLKVLYINPVGRYKQVFMEVYGG